MINTITIQPAAGLNYAYDSTLAFVKVIATALEGTVTDISTAVANRMCDYEPAEGRVYFENAFDGFQRVFIIYKTTSLT